MGRFPVFIILVLGIHSNASDILIGLFSPDLGDQINVAMTLAIEDINSNSSILPNYTINYLYNSSNDDAQVAMSTSVWQLTNHPNIIAIIGAELTVETQSIALLAGVYSVPTISYASTFIGLTDANGQKTYPTFMRVVPSDYFQAQAWVTLAKFYGWQRACLLTSTEPVHVILKDTFLSFVDPKFESFVQSFPTGTNMSSQLTSMKNSGCKIFYLACYFEDAAMVLFLAANLNLVGPNYAWIGSDSWVQSDFLGFIEDPEMKEVVQQAVRGAIGFTPYSPNDTETNIFVKRLEAHTTNFTGLSSYSTYAYDAVWTFGLGLHTMIMKGYIPHETINKADLLLFLKNTTFTGLTGKVSFDQNGDRIAPYDLRNFLPDGNLVTVGLFNPINESLQLYTYVTWYNGTNVPKDSPYNCNDIPDSLACEQVCQPTLTGPVCSCKPGWKINADGRTCTVCPCILSPWSAWEVCTQLCHYPKKTRTRSVNITASQGSPICVTEILSQDMGTYDGIVDSSAAIFVLFDEWEVWLPLQFQSMFGFNSTILTIDDSGAKLLIQVTPINDTMPCQFSSLNISSYLQEWAALCLPSVDLQRYRFSYYFCAISMSVDDAPSTKNTNINIYVSVPIIIVVVAGIVALAFWLRNRKLDLSSLPEQIRKPLERAELNSIKYVKVSNALSVRELRLDSDSYRYVLNLFENKLDGKSIAIEKIQFGFNKILLSAFISKRKIMTTRVTTAPIIFYKDTWKNRDPHKRREYVHHQFVSFIKEFVWNVEETVPIIPMLHGTDEGSALKIFESGFAALAQVDKGYYGKGIYFTTSAKYALTYCGYKDKPTLILAYIIPGHVYPTIEHPNSEHSLVGMPIIAGYQSHFVITNLEGMPASVDDTGLIFTELVVDQEPQVLPSYLLYPNPVSAKKVLSKFNFQKGQYRDNLRNESDIVIS